MEQTLCKVVALICIRSCFVIHPGAKAILFGSTRRTLVTVGECYLSLCKHNPFLSSSLATFRMFNYHTVPRASLVWSTGCMLSCSNTSRSEILHRARSDMVSLDTRCLSCHAVHRKRLHVGERVRNVFGIGTSDTDCIIGCLGRCAFAESPRSRFPPRRGRTKRN